MSSARQRGPSAGGTRAQVLSAAAQSLQRGELPEMGALASQTCVGRSTLHRWFGSREQLLGVVLARILTSALEQGYARSKAQGAARVAAAIESLLVGAAGDEQFIHLLRARPEAMLAVIMAPAGAVQEASISTVEQLIARERASGHYDPPLDPHTLAFALVQIGQAFMWARAATGAPPALAETMRVTRALLG